MAERPVDKISITDTYTRTLGLIITEFCNLDCAYCYVPQKRNTLMDIEIAKKAIKSIFDENRCRKNRIKIDFLGGEPLSAYPLIKEICEWMWSQSWDKDYYLFATTNGTLLTDEMKEWFTAHKDQIILGLSYDGYDEAQDINRSNSKGFLDIDFFGNTWPFQPFKMTISENAVDKLANNMIRLHESHINFIASFALGMPAWKEANITEFEKQMQLMMDYYLKNPDIRPTDLFEINLLKSLAYRLDTAAYCGMGKYYYVVDMNGEKYPCHMMSSLTLPGDKLEEVSQLDMWNREDYSVEECRQCVLYQLCPICYGMSYKCYGTPLKREENVCRLFRKQVLTVCKYRAKLLVRSTELTKEDKILARTISFLLKEI